MSALSAAASDEDGDTISALRAENEMLRQSLLAMHTTLEMTARAGAHHAMAAECLRETVIRWANRAEQAEAMLEAIGAGGVGKLERPQVEQGPVAFMHDVVASDGDPDYALSFSRDAFPLSGLGGFRSVGVHPLYTRPQPKREPLTAEQIMTAWNEAEGTRYGFFPFARAIERAHGITGENT